MPILAGGGEAPRATALVLTDAQQTASSIADASADAPVSPTRARRKHLVGRRRRAGRAGLRVFLPGNHPVPPE